MRIITLLFVFFFIGSCNLSGKVLIFTYAFNRPDFIEIHYKTFKKFLLDEYEFIVFNDAIDQQLCIQIEQVCAKYEIRCIRIPQDIHPLEYNASVRNCDVVNYSLKTIGFYHDDIVALFDSDLFLVRKFSIKDYMKDHDIAGQWQSRDSVNYLWIGLTFLNMATMPNKNTINFGLGFIGNTNTDSGGFTHFYLKNNPNVRVKWFDNIVYVSELTCNQCKSKATPICNHQIPYMHLLEFSNPLIYLSQLSRNSISEIYLKNTFLYYRAGSNWNCESAEYHTNKTRLLYSFLKHLEIEID